MSRNGASTHTVRLLTLTAIFALAACRAEKPAGPAQQDAASATVSASAAPIPSPVASAPAKRSKEQAMAALIALPELKAWSSRIDKASKGAARGALIEDDPAPRDINGKQYWRLSFVENASDAMHRWESFLVAQTGDDILVEDFTTDTTLTLEQWRREKHPLERSAAQ
jgi:hypothetical protein